MSVATISLYDTVTDSADAAVPNATVTLTFGYNSATTTDGLLQPSVRQVQTDSTGKFTFPKVIPNDLISPSNTVYILDTPFRTYQVAPQSGNGASQQTTAANVIVNTPSPLAPVTSNLTGPLTVAGLLTAQAGLAVTGNETISNNLSVGGTFTPSSITVAPGEPGIDTATAGALLLGDNTATSIELGAATTVSAGTLTVAAGLLTASVGLTVVGAVTLPAASIADAALSANIPLINAATNSFTGNLTLTAGDLTLTAGELIFADAVSQINPGATSFAITNNAGNANNLLLADAGLATLRNALSIPPSAGGTVPTTNYGTVQNTVDFQTPAAVATITVPASGNLPIGYRHLKIKWKLKSSTAITAENITLRFNGSAVANYYNEYLDIFNGTVTGNETNNALGTGLQLGNVPGTTAPANTFASGEITIFDYNSATDHKTVVYSTVSRRGTGASGVDYQIGAGGWVITPVAITTFSLLATGNLTGFVTTEAIP